VENSTLVFGAMNLVVVNMCGLFIWVVDSDLLIWYVEQIREHRIIYHLLEDIGSLIVGMAPGTKETQVAGQAEVSLLCDTYSSAVLKSCCYWILRICGILMAHAVCCLLCQVLNVFELKGKGREGKGATKIAGCRVFDGSLQRASRIRVLRSGEVMFEGVCQSLKREKLDVDMVGKGTECGMILQDWVDFRVGDVVQCIEDVRRMPKYVSSQNGAARIEC
jgi:translation initiation factor IF-2